MMIASASRASWLTPDRSDKDGWYSCALAGGNAAMPSLEAELPGLRLPALLYCGDQDAVYSGVKRATGLMPDATFLSLPGFDHVPLWLRSDLVAPHAQEFLARLARR